MTRQRWNPVFVWIVIAILVCLLLHAVNEHLSVTERFSQQKKLTRSQKQAIRKQLFAPPQATDRDHTKYLLWSGGVSSTFVLCDRIFRFGETVRPVHFSLSSMDNRQSVSQERETVYAMESYLHSEFPTHMKSKLLPLIEYVHIDSDTPTKGSKITPTTKTSPENVSKALGIAISHPCMTFYVKLAALACSLRSRKPYHKNSQIIVILPKYGHYQSMRRCVELLGTANHPHDPSRFVVKPNTPALNTSMETGDRNVFVALYKHVEWVLPDKSSQGLHMKQHALNNNPPFEHVLRRTWSCQNPTWTNEQEKRRKQNPLSMITTMPTGKCNMCISCEQRLMDGLHRID